LGENRNKRGHGGAEGGEEIGKFSKIAFFLFIPFIASCKS
jgi:hypothetical protein